MELGADVNRALLVVLFSILSGSVFANQLGKTTYQIACSNCHAPNYAKAIGAPAVHDTKAWAARFKKAQLEVNENPLRYKTPLTYLLNSVVNGKKLMHHGGLCHESPAPHKNCSNEALIAAINYMSQP